MDEIKDGFGTSVVTSWKERPIHFPENGTSKLVPPTTDPL